jgi:hypothetical protein
MLWVKRSRSRVKRSSDVECALCRQWCAPGVGGVEDLKHASSEKFHSNDHIFTKEHLIVIYI